MKKLIIYYFLFLLSLLSIFSSGVIDSQDGFQYLAVARNIYYTGKPTAPPYEYDTRKNIHMSVVTGKDGNTYSLTGLGYSLAYLPAVAITDMVYKFYGVSPPVHFPLENDWLIFLTASFTNSFFGASLGVILFLYLLELGLSRKQAILISLVGLFSTNLLVYAKHSFPHMMFITFLFLSFYLIKIHFKTKKLLFLILSGISFGITSITYNQTFVLSVLPVFIYSFMLSNSRLSFASLKILANKFLLFFLGWFPFILIYFWFENLRATPAANFSSPAAASAAVSWLAKVPVGVFIEGVHGQLFSPGRSIFLYSPVLLVILIFWYKIKKRIFPEFIISLILSIIYILFHATFYSVGGQDQGITPLWHGEASWGPRYLTPLIPFGLLTVGFIFTQLRKIEKRFIFYPSLLVGFYIGLLGVLMPYQIKLYDLQDKFFLNGTEYKASAYSNFLPRYTPILAMSKNFIKLIQNFPKTFDRGMYNARLYDGIDFTFPVGGERWRVIEGKGHILFDNLDKNPIKKFTFGLINHPIDDSNSSAKLTFILNDQILTDKSVILKAKERNVSNIHVNPDLLKDKANKLDINVDYEDQDILKNKKQILGLIAFSINDVSINLESIDVPYVSRLGPVTMSVKYENWGGEDKDPWRFWDIHTQTYERLPDIWWIRNLYYWDIPKLPIVLLFTSIVLVSLSSGLKILRLLRKS